MKILDRYIIKQVLSTFFFVMMGLVAIIVVIDITEKIDKFNEKHIPMNEILKYYMDFVPWISGLLTPIICFIAIVYVTSRLAAHTEIIAMLSSGISFRRMLLPYFIAAGVIAALSFVFNGWVIPHSNADRLVFEMTYFQNKYYFESRNVHMQTSPNVYLYIQTFNNQSNTGYQFSLEKFDDNNMLVEKLTADNIQWDSVQHKWKLRYWKRRMIDEIFQVKSNADSLNAANTVAQVDNQELKPVKENNKPVLTSGRARRMEIAARNNHSTVKGIKKESQLEPNKLEDKPKLLGSAAAHVATTITSQIGVPLKGDALDTTLIITPEDFENNKNKSDGLTIPELTKEIQKLRFRGTTGVEAYEVERHIRYAAPFTTFVLVFMGVIVSARKSRGGTGFQIALGFMLAFIFILFFTMTRTFAQTGSLTPLVAAWLPNTIFGIISLIMYKYVPR